MNKETAKQKYKNGDIQIYSDIDNMELLRYVTKPDYVGLIGMYYEFTSGAEPEPKPSLTIVKLSEITETEEVENYDFINPAHYKKFSFEVIEMMEAIWGKEATAIHCEMCAFKYRLRMGEKPDQPIERDLEKVNWYLSKAKELRS